MQTRAVRRTNRLTNSKYATRHLPGSTAPYPFFSSSTPAKKSQLRHSHSLHSHAESYLDLDSTPEGSDGDTAQIPSPSFTPSYELEYRQESLQIMRQVAYETMPVLGALQDHLSQGQWRERAHAIDFVITIHTTSELTNQTLFLAINIMDRYLSLKKVPDGSIHLVMLTSWWIAAKFTEQKGRVPSLENISMANPKAYSKKQYLNLERTILMTLNHQINHPTAPDWLAISIENDDNEYEVTEHVARFLMEFSLYFIEYREITPDHLAEAALYLARIITRPMPFAYHDDIRSLDIASCLDQHLSLHGRNNHAYIRYSKEKHLCASVIVANWYADGNTFKAMCAGLSQDLSPEKQSAKISQIQREAWSRRSIHRATSQTPSLSFTSTTSSANSPSLSEFSVQTPETPCHQPLIRGAVSRLQQTAQAVQATRALKMSLRSHTANRQSQTAAEPQWSLDT